MTGTRLTLDGVRQFAENVARKSGWLLNPDDEFRTSVLEGLYDNYNQFGYLLCPCRESWEEIKKDRDVVCPCTYAKEDVEEYGHCYCGLYMSKEFVQSGNEAEDIPERRPEELIPE